MKSKRINAIYDRLPQLVVELDPDPVGRGPAYLQEKISLVRGMLNEVGVYLQEVIRSKGGLESDLEALTSAYEIASNDLMANDERVSRLPAVQDRMAMINVLLGDEYRAILEKRRDVNDLGYVEKAVKHRHRELEQTMSAIRLQRSLLQSDMRTGAFYGDESGQSRGDSFQKHDSGDDIDSDDIDSLMDKANAEEGAGLEVFDGGATGEDPDIEDLIQPEAQPEPKAKADPLSEVNDLLGGYDSDVSPEDEPLLFCSACGEPQFETPGGMSCKNGHGGAPSVDEVPKPEPSPEEPKPEPESKPEKAPPEKEDPDVTAFLDDEDDFSDVFDNLP